MNSSPANQPDERSSEAEAIALIDALLEQQISTEQLQRLDQLVCENRDICRLYIRCVHLRYGIPLHLGPPLSILDDESFSTLFAGNPMMETMVMPALSADDLPNFEPEIVDLPREPAALPIAPQRKFPHFPRRYLALAAAVLIAGATLGILVHRATQTETTPHAARLTAFAGADWDPHFGIGSEAGAVLNGQQVLHLRHGAAEVAFDSGATVVLEGPAVLRIMDGGHAQLDEGKLTAYVPPPAHGFAVSVPGATITDHGTEFGVSVDGTGNVSVHVFQGEVAVARSGASDPPMSLTVDQGVKISAAGLVEQTSHAQETYVRELAQYRAALPLHNTGAQLNVGDADPYWQIAAQSSNPSISPIPAIVADNRPAKQYPPNDPNTSQWLALSANLPDTAIGTYVFRGTIDLTGFNPETAVVHAKVAADDYVIAVRVNGKEVPIPPALRRVNRHFTLITLDLSGPTAEFHDGINEVDFIVYNGPSPHDNYNPMAFRAEWEGNAVLVPSR